MIMTVARANQLIPWIPCKRSYEPMPEQSIEQITKNVMEVLRDHHALIELFRFSRQFKGHNDFSQRLLLTDLFRFVKEHIAYIPDQVGAQWVKNPICTWSQRHEGTDCKSLTVFIYAVLYCLGLPRRVNIYVYPPYESNSQLIHPSHIFPSTILAGEVIYLDATLDTFSQLPATPIEWFQEVGI